MPVNNEATTTTLERRITCFLDGQVTFLSSLEAWSIKATGGKPLRLVGFFCIREFYQEVRGLTTSRTVKGKNEPYSRRNRG